MRLTRLAVAVALVLHPAFLAAQEVVEPPSVILSGVPFRLTLQGAEGSPYVIRDATGAQLGSGALDAGGGAVTAEIEVSSGRALPLAVTIGDSTVEVDATVTPPLYSIIPPLVAIVLALVFREVVTALFFGVWLGALAVAGFDPLAGTWRLVDTFVVPALGDTENGHTQIVIFSLLLGGMVGIISRNGGTLGIVEAVAPFARTARRGKLATWAAGMAIFFDDYANTLIVGNTMRPITDRLRISREKLAYLVDSTAAPVAALVPISTWVGYEISLIGDGLEVAAQQTPGAASAILAVNEFAFFIQTIPYLFYPLLALAFVVLTSAMDRDFGPMASAERRAADGGGLFRTGATLAAETESAGIQAKSGVPHRWWNAGAPVLTVIFVVLVGLFTTGRASAMPGASLSSILTGPEPIAALKDVFGAADPFSTLLWGSLAGCLVALGLSVGQRALSLHESIDALVGGMRSMMIAMIILTLAWSLGDVTESIGTSQFLALLLSDRIAVEMLPAIVFVTSATMAFATGTSWGTMAIMLPVAIPLTVSLGGAAMVPGGGAGEILLGSTASVLAGAIFGDHCSPISDTTVLSSTASACDHVDHVRTQLPYALLVAVPSIVVGNIGTAYGLSPWLALPIAVVLLFAFLRAFGTSVSADDDALKEILSS